jgi:hypothetical protein
VNIPFDFTFAGADSAEFFKNDTLANNGNASLKAITDAGYTLAECQIVLPVASDLAPFVWVTALNLEVSAACVVDIGFLNESDAFVPLAGPWNGTSPGKPCGRDDSRPGNRVAGPHCSDGKDVLEYPTETPFFSLCPSSKESLCPVAP